MSKSKTTPTPKTFRVELKYCERCGCLLTRAIGSCLTFCDLCEIKYSEEEMYLTPPKRRVFKPSTRPARLPIRIDLKACADTANYRELKECA